MVLERLEALPVGSFHYKLLLVTGLGWLFDSMDTGLIAFILPVLAKEWQLAPGQMGLIGSIGLIGMALGAVISGTVADHLGRKKVFSITVLLYSIASALCAISWDYQSLLLFRFLVGFGLGGELPVAATLVSEYAPSRVRGRFIVLLESFWGLGWIAAACIAYFFIPVYGWRMAFALGAVPAVYVFLIRLHMPESVRYLLSRGKVEEARAIVTSLERKLHVPVLPFSDGPEELPPATTVSFLELWKKPYMKRTIMLWLVWFGINFSYYGIFMWLPSLVFQQGFTVVKTFEYVLVMTLTQLPGYYCAAWLVDKLGRKYTLSVFLLFSGVASYFFGHASTAASLMMWGSVMSFFNLGAWGVLYTYTPEQYPTTIRALGSGWAAGFGRFGGMAAPVMVGVMIGHSFGFGAVFYMFAFVFIAVAAVVMGLGIESKQKDLESITTVQHRSKSVKQTL